MSPRRLSIWSVASAWLTKPWKNSWVRSTSGKVYHDPRQRLVQWDIGAAITRQAGLVAERLLDCLAKCYAYVFDRVMAIDMQIAFR